MRDKDYFDGIEYLQGVDPKLNWIVKNVHLKSNHQREASFEALVRIIIGQQLSGAAADTIFNRLKTISKSDKLDTDNVLSMSREDMRNIGISQSKSKFIMDLARHVDDHPNFIENLKTLSAEKAIIELTKLNGIGIWSASIFAMFYLGCRDIFANSDTSIEKAIISIYGRDHVCGSDEWFALQKKWEPFKTVACIILWSWVDAKMPEIID